MQAASQPLFYLLSMYLDIVDRITVIDLSTLKQLKVKLRRIVHKNIL